VTAPPSRREEARRSWFSYSFRPELKSVAESLREIRGEEGGGGVVRKGRKGGREGGSEGERNEQYAKMLINLSCVYFFSFFIVPLGR